MRTSPIVFVTALTACAGTLSGGSGDTETSGETSGTSGTSDGSASGAASTGAGSTGTSGDGGPYNVAFTTSKTWAPAELGGLAGADAKCQAEAEAAGLSGTFKAWLSDSTTDARTRFGDARGWVRPDGKPFLRDLNQLLVDQEYWYPINMDAFGVPVGSLAVTGTAYDGTKLDDQGVDLCGDWTTNAGDAAVGDPEQIMPSWTAFTSSSCATPAALVCFQVDYQNEVPAPPPPERVAFLSSGGIAASSGRAKFDELCQQEAEAAGYTGTFLAALSTTTEAAAARFDPNGPPWARPDGVEIFAPGEAFPANNRLQAQLSQTANGSPAKVILAFGGSSTPTAPAGSGESCEDWSQDSGYAFMVGGYSLTWWGFSLDGGQTQECTIPYGVACFQE